VEARIKGLYRDLTPPNRRDTIEQHCPLGDREDFETRCPEGASFRQMSDFVEVAGNLWPFGKVIPDGLIFILRIAADQAFHPPTADYGLAKENSRFYTTILITELF
jgi:hypothetical protein